MLSELWEHNAFSTFKSVPVSASSVCDARKKMPPAIFTELNQSVLAHQENVTQLPLWYGRRVFGVDGSKINLPRKLLDADYKAPNQDQYYPQGLFSTLYHLGSGLIYDGMISADRCERTCLLAHMERLEKDDVLVLDRGYFSYLVISKAMEKGLHLICRMQNGNVNKEVKDFLISDSVDDIITYTPSLAVKYATEKRGYNVKLIPIKLRLIKYVINDETYVCSTTLLDEKYSINALSKAYHGRWGIEELYKVSKEFIGLEDFHGHSECGVLQECYAHILMINIARIFESEAIKTLPTELPDDKEHQEPQDSYWKDFCGEFRKVNINFKNCLLVLGRGLVKLIFLQKEMEHDWINRLVQSISRIRQKIRRGRHVPRISRRAIRKWRSGERGKKHQSNP
nr:IS4 family transposase [Moritella viscosa]